jgi:hypothetical protein
VDHHDPLMMGMFWGGLLVASVPILLTLGVGIYVFRQWRGAREAEGPDPPPGKGLPRTQTEGGGER